MHDGDKDLHDLDQLIGHLKADYRDMRHDGDLVMSANLPRSPRRVYLYTAATAAAVLLIAIIGANLPSPQAPTTFAKLRIPDRGTLPLSLRPVSTVKPVMLSAKRTFSLRMPRRPVAKKS